MTKSLLQNHPLFLTRTEHLTQEEQIALSYRRARAVVRAYSLDVPDILLCSPKFWALNRDPILALDFACYTIIAAHVNLAIGTLSRYAAEREDIMPYVQSLLRMDTVGLFLLSERGHGLDSFNIETTATATEHGFILNTPTEEAAKWMPATTPCFGFPKIAVVMARLMVSSEDRGVRAFLVPICDSTQMFKGITSCRLPPRSGTCPLDFAITIFDHVELPFGSLLGSLDRVDADRPQAWWEEVWRIPIGTAAVTGPVIQALKHAAYIGGSYSLHRHVLGKGNTPVPIITFRTQQRPVLQAIAASLVLDTWYQSVSEVMSGNSLDTRVGHAIAIVFKATAGRLVQSGLRDVRERCGAQGTFQHNFIARAEADIHGALIAEGEVLTLCIKLFMELLLGRYEFPEPAHTDSILWQHFQDYFAESRRMLTSSEERHRGDYSNRFLLPRAESTIIALGHALAYSAAVEAGLPSPVVKLFELSGIRQLRRLSPDELVEEDRVINSALLHMEEYLARLDVEGIVYAPIVSDTRWKDYASRLPRFSGNAELDNLLPTVRRGQARL